MKVKVLKSGRKSYWYNSHIGRVFKVKDHTGEMYVVDEPNLFDTEHFIDCCDCRPLKKGEPTHSTPYNSDYVTALWEELNKRNSGLVPEKSNWIPITKKRLNSAIKRLNHT